MTDRLKLVKVTDWSAETPDGAIYAEKAGKGRKWAVCRLRGRGHGTVGEFSSFKAAAEFVANLGGQS